MVKFQGPTAKWLDRPINDDHVDELVAVLQDNPCAMVNSQLWLGICQIPRDGIKEVNDVKGCKIISHLLMGYIGKSLWKSKFNLYFQAVRTVCLWQFHNCIINLATCCNQKRGRRDSKASYNVINKMIQWIFFTGVLFER